VTGARAMKPIRLRPLKTNRDQTFRRAAATAPGLPRQIHGATDRREAICYGQFSWDIRGAFPLNPTAAPRALEDVGAPPFSEPPHDRIKALEALILNRLDEDKAQDVVFVDLKGKSAMADGLVVASGRSHRHVGAMADHLLRALKDEGYGKARVEGMPHCDWVLIDTGDVIVHLFRPEVRAFYNIEKIWSVEPPTRTATL
jgi:ribosome-associated protein